MELNLQTTELNFHITFQKSGMLPDYPGSILRSTVGLHLFEQSCIVEEKNCENCRYQIECPYGFLYEPNTKWQYTYAADHLHFLPPHYLFEAPALQQEVRKGSVYQFKVKLFQADRPIIKAVIAAVYSSGKSGLGTERVQFSVDAVTQRLENGTEIEDDHDFKQEERTWQLDKRPVNKRIVIQSKSPIRLQKKGKLLKQASAKDFFQALARRTVQTQMLWNQGDPIEDQEILGAVSQLEDKNVCEWDSTFYQQKRYSRSQGKEVSLHGQMIKGVFDIHDDRLIQLLRYGSYVHLGKQTAFGLGHYEVWMRM